MANNKPPIKTYRAGPISASVFENTVKLRDGTETKVASVQIRRNYKDDKGEWKTTDSYRKSDLASLALVANKTYEFLTMEYGKNEEE